ncbi:CHASE3 domain sensor protein [Wenyingzhuangia heitensis]|uniref:CHASE3 domain sensor protein n=1 Tax=Wenyingzhuangia heitensis TaxID=1487859 RepID=A0ABX0UA19_9FLAO|nr:DUF6730 family protein [Wenyingzhuangia heitensis]NIJ45660.1 CHASE3 domain sensor protein [Wenyingzhuangia heitensis]
MAKIEIITELIVDEINHMETLVKEFKQEKEALKKIKIEPNTDRLKAILSKHIEHSNKQNEEHTKLFNQSIVELKHQNKRFLMFTIVILLSVVLLFMGLLLNR